MKARINGIELEGTVEEMKALIGIKAELEKATKVAEKKSETQPTEKRKYTNIRTLADRLMPLKKKAVAMCISKKIKVRDALKEVLGREPTAKECNNTQSMLSYYVKEKQGQIKVE